MNNLRKKMIYSEIIAGFRVYLTRTGNLFVGLVSDKTERVTQFYWYRNPATRQPWIPKHGNFISMIKRYIENGMFKGLLHDHRDRRGTSDRGEGL